MMADSQATAESTIFPEDRILGKLEEIDEMIIRLVKRLNEIASAPAQPNMFRIYNGSERHNRLRLTAKEIGDAAASLLSEVQTTRNCSEITLNRMVKQLNGFGEEISRFSPADGKHYLIRMCDRCCMFLMELANGILANAKNVMKGEITNFRGLDVGRLLDAAPVSTLQLATETWELWAGQAKEAIVEIQRVSAGVLSNDDEEDNPDSFEAVISPCEKSLAEKVFLLSRLVKTMIRKIRLRCIQPIFEPIETFEEIKWLDELMEAGEALFPAIDELATCVLPVQVTAHICSESVTLVRLAQRVCELGWQQSGHMEHQKWFINCYSQLDSLLLPIIESNPTR